MPECFGCRKDGKAGRNRVWKCKTCAPKMKAVKKTCYQRCLSGMKRKSLNYQSAAAKAECRERCRKRK